MIKKGFVFLVLLLVITGCAPRTDYLGSLFRRDTKSSFEKILKLAKSGNVEAMYYVGLSYEIGNGVKLSYKKAFKWYIKAANLGYPRAQYNLAFMYRYGYGTRKNMIQSYKWFYILGDAYECKFDAQQMTKEEIKRAIIMAKKWENRHGY